MQFYMQVYLFMVAEMHVLFKSEGLWWLFLLNFKREVRIV